MNLFLEKLASTRDYTDCIKKIAYSAKENAESNEILTQAVDSLDNDDLEHVLDIELDDNLSDAIERMKKDK